MIDATAITILFFKPSGVATLPILVRLRDITALEIGQMTMKINKNSTNRAGKSMTVCLSI